MHTYGVRISDDKNNVLNVNVSEILSEIKNHSDFYWCVLFLDGIPSPGHGDMAKEYKNKINKSQDGFPVAWDELRLIGNAYVQIYEIMILGCVTKEFLCRYDNDKKMYQACDVVIELIDCAFWQFFAKDEELINRLKSKYKEVEQPNIEI